MEVSARLSPFFPPPNGKWVGEAKLYLIVKECVNLRVHGSASDLWSISTSCLLFQNRLYDPDQNNWLTKDDGKIFKISIQTRFNSYFQHSDNVRNLPALHTSINKNLSVFSKSAKVPSFRVFWKAFISYFSQKQFHLSERF